eukprot:c4703_g1_i1.p1 GENE.c4703_g1_i1~~c4703_g1_i1.p1  ORF type:complete len:556 (-),score=108.18 c4703_g1_i1:673-2340(-)
MRASGCRSASRRACGGVAGGALRTARRLGVVALMVLSVMCGVAHGAPRLFRFVHLDISQPILAQITLNGVSVATQLNLGESTPIYYPVESGRALVQATLKLTNTLGTVLSFDTAASPAGVQYYTVIIADSSVSAAAGLIRDSYIATTNKFAIRNINFRLAASSPAPTGTLTVTQTVGATTVPVDSALVPFAYTNADSFVYFPVNPTSTSSTFNFALDPPAPATTVRRNVTSPQAGSVTCFFYSARPTTLNVTCPGNEHAFFSGQPLPPGTLSSTAISNAVIVTGSTEVAIDANAPTIVYNDMLVDGNGAAVQVRSDLTVYGSVNARRGLLSIAAGVTASFETLLVGINGSLGVALDSSRGALVTVHGAATLTGGIVVDVTGIPFLAGSIVQLFTCAPCSGAFSSLRIVTYDTGYTLPGVGARGNVLSEHNGTLLCNTTMCLLRADASQLGFSRTSSGNQIDKIVLASVLLGVTVIVLIVVVVRELRPRKRGPGTGQDHVIQKTLRRHDRKTQREARQKGKSGVLGSADLSLSVMDDESVAFASVTFDSAYSSDYS